MKKNNRLVFLFIIFLFINSPLFAEDPIKQAEKYFQLGKYEEALKTCNNIKQIYPDSDWALTAGLLSAKIYEKKNQTEKAVDEYKSIIKDFRKNPQAEEAFFEIGKLFMSKNNYDRAINAYNLYLKNYPRGQYKVMALFNIASLYKIKGDYDKALFNYDEILHNYVSDVWFYNWSAIYSGHIYHSKRNFDKATEYYDMVIKNDENKYISTLASLYKGINFIDKGDNKDAEDLFQNMIKNRSLFVEEALIGLAIAQYKDGDYELAKESFSTLVDTFPDTLWKTYADEKIKILDKRLAKIKQKEE